MRAVFASQPVKHSPLKPFFYAWLQALRAYAINPCYMLLLSALHFYNVGRRARCFPKNPESNPEQGSEVKPKPFARSTGCYEL